jgi:integrase
MGHIRKRAKNIWSIVVDVGKDPITNKRKQRWQTVKGTKRDAERELRHILVNLENGTYVKPNRLTVGE